MAFKITILFLFCVTALFSAPIHTENLERGSLVTRSKQLEEIAEVVRPSVLGYLSFGTYYFPHPRQTALKTDFGKLDAFAFKQRFTAYFAAPVSQDFSLGFLWWLERHGIDSEDFILFPKYGEYALIRNVQTLGLSFHSKKLKSGIAGGIHYSNPEYVSERIYKPESDSLLYFAHFYTGPLLLQGTFGESGFSVARMELNLESKELYGGASSGITTYLPNIELLLFKGDDDYPNLENAKLSVEQNLYRQRLYGEASFILPDYGFYSAALKFYPDPSRLLAFEATCTREENGDLFFGGGLHFLFFRMAYNHAYDYENLFHSKGTFIFEISISIGSTQNNFFSKNAAKAAPMETKSRIIHEQGSTYQGNSLNQEKKPVKEITATGIRMENAK